MEAAGIPLNSDYNYQLLTPVLTK